MADQSRRRRNRPDSKQMWDESDRRSRHEPNPRDKRDDHGRDREDNYRERDRRYRSRSRSPRRDRRERPRERDRRDRDRDDDKPRQRDDDRARPRGDDFRDRKERDRRRDRDEAPPKGAHHNAPSQQPPSSNRVNHGAAPARDRSPRRSASPRRSPDRGLARHTHSNSPLPTRSKPGASKPEPSASLQFKVGGNKHDDEVTRGIKTAAGSRFHDSQEDELERGRRRTETPGSHGGDAMDEDEEEEDIMVEDDGLSAMQAMMGFGGFGTTKNTHIPGNNAGAVRKEKKTEYRQYMNRVGGFNRPLSPTRQ
ncbi:hypothetical protein M426DRAFT_317631 [Hypoxylon sp. CI-4A]|nr:hypothetical protein M426DRAFT_317631 [Hypoxylon sp. CI-4A]